MTAIHHARRPADFEAFLVTEQLLEIEEEIEAVEFEEWEARSVERESAYLEAMRALQREQEDMFTKGFYYCPVAGHYVEYGATAAEFIG